MKEAHVGEAGVGHSASPSSSLAVWFDTIERPSSWPLTPANALHAEWLLNTHNQPIGLISARPFLLPRWNVLFHGPLPGNIWTFHSIPFLAYRAARVRSWNAALSLTGREVQHLGRADELSWYLPWNSGLPGEEEVALRSPLISFPISSCFSLSSSDKSCQGRDFLVEIFYCLWSWGPDTPTSAQQLWHPFLPREHFTH